MRIAIVNDLKMATLALQQVVESIPKTTVAWTAEDGEQALRRCREDLPDLILMDMIMPVMNGVEATRRIMQECPCPIVVVTATVTGNADLVYDALGHGALDAVGTPVLGTGGDLSGADELVGKIRAVERLTRSATASPPVRSSPLAPREPDGASPLVAIGASTGGPQAIVRILAALTRPLPCPVIIVQHVDPIFAPGLADWLARETGLPVEIAIEGRAPAPDGVAIASTADHLILDRAGRFAYVTEPADLAYRPSVDVLFLSLLDAPVVPSAAVLLTGMGRDGAHGLLALRRAGWHTIAQDKETSVVWGMPGAAVSLGAAVETLAVGDVPASLAWHMTRIARGRN